MTLSEKIVSLRKAHGWSQEDFAEKLNVLIILVRGKRQSGEPEIASPATGNHF